MRLMHRWLVVWAKDETMISGSLIVERGMEGFSTAHHMANGASALSATGELVFDNVKVPKQNIFPTIKGLKGPLSCLTKARFGDCMGHHWRCYGLL